MMRHFLTVTANVRAGVGYCLPVRLLQEPRNLNGRFTISDDSGHSSLELVPIIINNDRNPGASRLPFRARPRLPASRLATSSLARIRTDERVPRGLLPGFRPQLSTAPRPRTMLMTTTNSLEHDKRSHQTNNRRINKVAVRTTISRRP